MLHCPHQLCNGHYNSPCLLSSVVQVDDDVDLDALAGLTDGYSGADVAIVCRDAAMMSVRRVMKGAMERGLSGPEIQKHVMEMKDELAAAVTMEDFRASLRKVMRYYNAAPMNDIGVFFSRVLSFSCYHHSALPRYRRT